jgi:membrane-associated phospholipid phosphatase
VLLVFLGLSVFLLSLWTQILKKLTVAVIAIAVLVIPYQAAAQETKPDQSTPASQPATEPEAVGPRDPSPESRDYERPVSWKTLGHNVLEDQKHIWTLPARLVHGHDWAPTAAVLAITAGLIVADPKESAYFRNTTTFNGFRTVFNGNATAIGMGAVPASLYAIGLLRKDSKMQHTALLGGEALADIAIVQTVLKDVARRTKPARYPDSGWFDSKGPPAAYIRGNGSFPSGHSMAAFSVATIVAREYRNHKWVPYVAYGLAAAVGFSRLTLNVHFLSDIAMGGAIGYSISRFTVLRQ